MAHWFHRNPIKATNAVTFDFGGQASTPLARNICSEARSARSNLLTIFADPTRDLTVLTDAAEKYLSILRGFVEPTVDPNSQRPPAQAPNSEGGEVESMEVSSSATGDSKLRNAIKFTWSNTLAEKHSSQHDFVFEQINILFNIALWHTKHAAALAGAKEDIAEDDAKEVHKCLRSAAGIFNYIDDKLTVKLFERTGDGTDLDPNIIKAYAQQCTAEAQEVTVARAIELKHASNLVSSLAFETGKQFKIADNSLKAVEENLVQKWRKYLQLKATFYLSYAHCYNGQTLLAQDKCGEAVRALKESKTQFEKADDLGRSYTSTKGAGKSAKPHEHAFFRRLLPLVRRNLEKVERENGFIYYQKVPEVVPELPSKATYGLASPVEFVMPSKHEDWTAETYNGFKISKPDAEKREKEKDDAPKPVKEVPVNQTDKESSNSSGCTIS
ncbi:BRO1 domain-containing protein BROX-like [Lytechinus variegatus]|uniref:BRO1 domain-containing protein BROX-like n=1 Tax=Lytechinus variegatus TaxID=7654 RepID=UPI001BB24172|nr:BRO1 domain-containing protein BROX-like [Lytechinus variegatus]